MYYIIFIKSLKHHRRTSRCYTSFRRLSSFYVYHKILKKIFIIC